jgi:Carbamoyltransferase C-terminus
MMQVFQVRTNKRTLIPAVTHVDGSGRLQTVLRHVNPLYYRLIEKFRDITTVPMVLNTSTKTNLSSASPKRRWIASCGPRWTCWSSVTRSSRGRMKRYQSSGERVSGLDNRSPVLTILKYDSIAPFPGTGPNLRHR